jgi:hypothetical protein
MVRWGKGTFEKKLNVQCQIKKTLFINKILLSAKEGMRKTLASFK